MAQPAAPQDLNFVNTGFGIFDNASADEPVWVRVLAAAVVADETTKSGAVAVGGMRVHDATDTAAIGPLKVGGYAKAAAPSDVSADADIVNAWFLRNGALAVNITAAGALIAGDATRGLDVSPRPHTTGGLLTKAMTSQDGSTAITNSAQAIKASAGQLYGWMLYNPNDEASFINIYNIAHGSVTVGTDAPLFHIPLPAGAAANVLGTHGITFDTAISASATKTAGSNTAPDTAMEATFFYK